MREPPYEDDSLMKVALVLIGLLVTAGLMIGLSQVAIHELGPEPVSTLVPLEAP